MKKILVLSVFLITFGLLPVISWSQTQQNLKLKNSIGCSVSRNASPHLIAEITTFSNKNLSGLAGFGADCTFMSRITESWLLGPEVGILDTNGFETLQGQSIVIGTAHFRTLSFGVFGEREFRVKSLSRPYFRPYIRFGARMGILTPKFSSSFSRDDNGIEPLVIGTAIGGLRFYFNRQRFAVSAGAGYDGGLIPMRYDFRFHF